jgi:hypothetical protein
MTATAHLRTDRRLRVVAAAEILASVEAHPHAEPVTTADWHHWLPYVRVPDKHCRDCGGPDILAGRRFCRPCRYRRLGRAAE